VAAMSGNNRGSRPARPAKVAAPGCLIGSDLISAMYEYVFHQFVHQATMPIIPASHVSSESGTGLVHCAPAHGIKASAMQAPSTIMSCELPGKVQRSMTRSMRVKYW
jgi:isoleucyl-tRNA synthetase